MPKLCLDDRAIISLSGKDADALLQGLITTDLGALAEDEVRPGALLTPQGKILFDFLISRDGEALRVETSLDQVEALLKRLTMYKLRSAVELSLLTPAPVAVVFGEERPDSSYRDHRFEKAGLPVFRLYRSIAGAKASVADYDRLRIATGVAAVNRDYALQDAFPHDVLMDLNGGLSFRKGCYVGQEVVSRMQHRGTARRRVVIVASEAELPPTGTSLAINGRPIGSLGTVQGKAGLAIVRIDKAGEAIAKGDPILAGEVPVTLKLPGWTGLAFPAEADEASA
ncbi:aminomethyltransferase [Sinorhizobium fredii USDA 205]|uniref:Folate-binding protein n=1 Tax=Rhizobium fredii TaxID=380 RepID=A0A844A5H1_RHIFR|nr:folate-binding protein YgfZ [Sinorhizobium fredii]AWM24270.1 Folate-dependent protein for Fe/S cluster synthesis/repair in oxidative stress [Sinorhizobium fredii CCBAU 25509]KSV81489.1 aminomethyltransferase [Sinorhizobium fredii USDA 205]MCG5473949.1 folate-binding protein YgfZ [Sinorhizobium fredii]MQW96819.1 folate-binding protein [Sinorhizobium fredii]MQX07352.1 folate-binding protein [Sinorhizobium fredii]